MGYWGQGKHHGTPHTIGNNSRVTYQGYFYLRRTMTRMRQGRGRGSWGLRTTFLGRVSRVSFTRVFTLIFSGLVYHFIMSFSGRQPGSIRTRLFNVVLRVRCPYGVVHFSILFIIFSLTLHLRVASFFTRQDRGGGDNGGCRRTGQIGHRGGSTCHCGQGGLTSMTTSGHWGLVWVTH